MDHLWMFSCQASFYVKVGVVWVAIVGRSSPQDSAGREDTTWKCFTVAIDRETDQWRLLVEISYLSAWEQCSLNSCARFKPPTIVSQMDLSSHELTKNEWMIGDCDTAAKSDISTHCWVFTVGSCLIVVLCMWMSTICTIYHILYDLGSIIYDFILKKMFLD